MIDFTKEEIEYIKTMIEDKLYHDEDEYGLVFMIDLLHKCDDYLNSV